MTLMRYLPGPSHCAACRGRTCTGSPAARSEYDRGASGPSMSRTSGIIRCVSWKQVRSTQADCFAIFKRSGSWVIWRLAATTTDLRAMTNMIIGAHSVINSKNPEADRAFLRDTLKLTHVDVGHGWLIFGLPPAEVAVHPSKKTVRKNSISCAQTSKPL